MNERTNGETRAKNDMQTKTDNCDLYVFIYMKIIKIEFYNRNNETKINRNYLCT